MNNLVLATGKVLENLDTVPRALLKRSSTVVVESDFDHTERILEAMNEKDRNTQFKVIGGQRLQNEWIDPQQVLIINCSGRYLTNSIKKVRNFVEAGGWLVTTDWAIETIIEPAFPNTIKKIGSTRDDVVKIEVENPNHPITQGVIDRSEFWLESGSYLIDPIDERKVFTFIRSAELKSTYKKTDLIMVGFQHGKGKVFHSTSHFELQRSKSGETRMQDAYSSIRLLTNILCQKALANTQNPV